MGREDGKHPDPHNRTNAFNTRGDNFDTEQLDGEITPHGIRPDRKSRARPEDASNDNRPHRRPPGIKPVSEMRNDREVRDLGSGEIEYRSEPNVVPDHGRQARVHRPTVREYKADSINRYRPSTDYNDPFRRRIIPPTKAEEDRQRARRMMADLIREHAPKLVRRRPDYVPELIAREMLPVARWILQGSLPADQVDAGLERFKVELLSEIKRIRAMQKNMP